MPDLNEAKIMGHLTEEPEIRSVSDSKVSQFSVAVNRDFSEDETRFL